MEVVTVSPRFQIVIPKRIRESMGLKSGEDLQIRAWGDSLQLSRPQSVRSARGFLKGMDTSFVREGDRL